MPPSVQAIGIGLVTFFSVFLPGVLFLWMGYELGVPAVDFLTLGSAVDDYHLKSEWWKLAALLFFGYLTGSLLDIVGATVLDKRYDKIIKRKAKWAKQFVTDKELQKYAPLLSAAHAKLVRVYLFSYEMIEHISSFSFCHSAVRAGNPQAAAEVDLFLAQSKFFRGAVVALAFFSLLVLVQWIAEGAARLDLAPDPLPLQWTPKDSLRVAALFVLPFLAGACFLRFVKLRFKSTQLCYEYFLVVARQGKLVPPEPGVCN